MFAPKLCFLAREKLDLRRTFPVAREWLNIEECRHQNWKICFQKLDLEQNKTGLVIEFYILYLLGTMYPIDHKRLGPYLNTSL